jgi:hypothetical protein
LANALIGIEPYWHEGSWVFDDEDKGLEKEPFVAGIPDMINDLVKDIPDARGGFRLLFSSMPFPGYQVELTKVREENGGTWYRGGAGESEGWLCPALFKYFEAAPGALYVRAEPRRGAVEVQYDPTEVSRLRDRVEELEKLVYRLTMENELLKKDDYPDNPPAEGGRRYWESDSF